MRNKEGWMTMNKSRTVGIVIWAIAFFLSVFLLFIVPNHISSGIYLTLVFDIVAFISCLVLWIVIFRGDKTPKQAFYVSPTITVSIIYLLIQLVICIAEGLLVDKISLRGSLILNFITMAIMWFLILSTIIAKNHAQRVDSRQKDHHVEL